MNVMSKFEQQGNFDLRTTYNRSDLTSRIIHIGFGAFHRGHQAVYNDVTNQASGDLWGICEVSMFSSIDKLKSQNCYFSVVEQSAEQSCTRLIRTVSEALDGRTDGIESIIQKIAEPQVSLVSLTVTEKGYCIDPQTSQLDIKNENIVHDLATDEPPKTVIGLLVQALKQRMLNGGSGLSIMSCDNIPENGVLTRNAVIGFAKRKGAELTRWIESNVTFPSTMVDRIVPAMQTEEYALIEKLVGVKDLVGVVCEDFSQWVIEDNFIAGRPDWALAGALFVDDVVPYEEMKLRMLNGSHSFLAYNGSLAGYEFIYQCMQDSRLKQVTKKLMLEQATSLKKGLSVDINSYIDLLLQRFSNQNIKHKTAQIAMDGSQKLPQRALAPFLILQTANVQITYLPVMIAGWAHYIINSVNNNIIIADPLSATFEQIVQTAETPLEALNQLLHIEKIFGQPNPALHELVTEVFINISNKGISAFIQELK